MLISTHSKTRAQKLNNPTAIAISATTINSIRYLPSLESALQDEPIGWIYLSYTLSYGYEVDQDFELSHRCWERAYLMNNIHAQCDFNGDLSKVRIMRHSYWICKAASQGVYQSINEICKFAFSEYRSYLVVRDPLIGRKVYNFGKLLAVTIFLPDALKIGEKAEYETKPVSLREKMTASENEIKALEYCYNFYVFSNHHTRNAINTWCLIARRYGLQIRDVRLIVSRLIWATKNECLYDMNSAGTIISQSNHSKRKI